MVCLMFGYPAFVLLVLVWYTKAAENNIRIYLKPNSRTDGRIEVLHGGTWGAVCDHSFGLEEAFVACKQLGYSTAVGFEQATGGISTIHLDDVDCSPGNLALHDCQHNGWGSHDCNSNENVGVQCSGGIRDVVSGLNSRANYYWDCDNFDTGVEYDFKNGKKALVHGSASFALSPINSGFKLQGQSSWVDLGDFSDNQCFSDPSTCTLTVAVWLRIFHRRSQKIYILGNKYSESRFRGFSVYTEHNDRLAGYVLGSAKYCSFWHAQFTTGFWFHFLFSWPSNDFRPYLNGHKAGHRQCNQDEPNKPYIENPAYTIGADESLAGNTNQYLDVAFDELTIWYSQSLSDGERKSFVNLAKATPGYTVNELTMKLPGKPWDSLYADSSSSAYTQLSQDLNNNVTTIYASTDSQDKLISSEITNAQNSGGALQITVQFNYSSISFWNGYHLYQSFFAGNFLGSSVEITNCKSNLEFCDPPTITRVSPHHDGWHIYVAYQTVAEHFNSPTFIGYTARAIQIDGGTTAFGYHTPAYLHPHGGFYIKLSPISTYSVTMTVRSLKGEGFSFSTPVTGDTIEAAPGSGPSYIEVHNLTSWSFTAIWGEITYKPYGIIQKYLVRLRNKDWHQLEHKYVNVTDERVVHYDGLYPGQRYAVDICGYTSHPNCGASSNSGMFQTVPLLPSKPPRNLQILHVYNHSVTLKWRVVEAFSENGDMKSYHARFKNLRSDKFEVYSNYAITDVNQQQFQHTFYNLKGLTPYNVELFLINQVGIGPGTNISFTTKESVPSRPPDNFTVANTTSDTAYFKWLPLDIEHTNGILLGYRLYYRLANSSDDWIHLNTTNTTAEFPVLALRTYEIKMCGFTAVGEGVYEPTMTFLVPGIEPQNFPIDVEVVAAQNDSLNVEWRFITPPERPAHFFIITATRNDTNITEARERLDVVTWSGSVYKYTVKGLQEFKWYNIRIAAGNLAGMAPFLNFTVRNRTAEGIPSDSPQNITAWNASSTSMSLQWLPVTYEYADGIIRGYRVYWCLTNISASVCGNTSEIICVHTCIDDVWESLQVNGSINTNAIVKNLEKFKDYLFKVSAFTSVGEGVKSLPVVARTDEDVPGHPPLNVIGHNTSSRSLNISWEPVPDQWQFGIIRGYQLNITNTRTEVTKVHMMPLDPTSYETSGLERYTNYSIQVAALTVKGVGNFSDPIIVITDEDVPSEGPPNIVCFEKTSTSLSIRWGVLPVIKAHGIVRHYKIFLNRTDGRESTRIDIQPYDTRNTSFNNLDEYVDYSVEVLAITIKGEGKKSNPVICRTDEDVPHDSPQGLNGYNTSDTSIKVFWQEVPSDDQNGIIIGYKLFYNTTLRNGDILKNTKDVARTNMQCEFTALLPFKYYDIQIAAKTSKGFGPRSNTTTILTEEESPKIPPGNVKAFNTSSTSITLSWQPIPPENVGGILRGYKIQWEEISYTGVVILQNETQLDNASFTSLSFTGLTKYQEYKFRILAFTKFDGVFSSWVSTLTDEDIPIAPPTNCSGYNMSKNEIEVTWDVLPRPHRNGIILGYNIYSDETRKHLAIFDATGSNNLTVMNTTGALSRSFLLDRLKPYEDYTFQIVAFTSKGEGPRCMHFVVRTEEEAPLFSPGNLTAYNTSSTSLNISWNSLNMSYIHGVFRGYRIEFTAVPEFPEAYITYGDPEAKRKRRAVFTLDKQITTVGVENISTELSGLAKYTNYSIQVMGFTKFIGMPTENITMITDEDKPGKTPQNFQGYNLSSTSLYLQWSPVPDGFVHGVLLGYRLYYRLTNLPLMPLINITYGPTTLSTTIDELIMFTNYTLYITAFTSKGEGPYTDPLVVCTDEDVASKSPLGFKVINLIKTHEIPMSWYPVPNGFLNGILIGYRIKMRQLSEGMEDIDGKEIHIDLGPDSLNWTARNLPNFATYTFQVVALTKYGEGVHSYVLRASTCPCEKNLTTNWYPLPPYTNKTEYTETGIFPWLIDNLVTECCGNCYNGHGWSNTFYKVDGKGADGFKYRIPSFKEKIDDDTDFHFPVQGHTLQEMYRSYYRYVFAVSSPGVAFFIVDDPPGEMPNAILATVSSSWTLILVSVILALIAGIVLWFLDTASNEVEFPRQFFKGAWEGFWWAFISMTTVGYGDRSPRSIPARLFSIVWILTGLIVFSILMGSITNALTTVTFASASIKLYGTKIAAIDGSPSHRIGIRRNAKVNQDNTYTDAYEIKSDLISRKVKGALLDGYMAGSYNELFEDKQIRIHELIDYNTGYGIVLGGQSMRLQKCFKSYVKRKRSFIVDYVASQIKTVKKNPQSAAVEKSTDLFNPEAEIFVLSITICLAMLLAAIVMGLCLHVYFKRRFRNKVGDVVGKYDKRLTNSLNELLESFKTRLAQLKQELYYKHANELRVLSGLERLPFKYDILKQLKEEQADQTEFDKCLWDSYGSTKSLIASRENLNEDPEKNIPIIFNGKISTPPSPHSPTERIEDDDNHEDDNFEDAVEEKPDIDDLQREAYLAGLKASGSFDSGHPYARMYRYLWVERNLYE